MFSNHQTHFTIPSLRLHISKIYASLLFGGFLYLLIIQFKKKEFFNLVTLAYHISLNKISLWGREHIKRSTQYAFPSKACHIKILIKKARFKSLSFSYKEIFLWYYHQIKTIFVTGVKFSEKLILSQN